MRKSSRELPTHDSIRLRGAGTALLSQPAKGARFTLDSLLLADFCRVRRGDRVLEPGAGTGIVSILLAKKFPHARFTADEVEPGAFSLLERNIELNGLSDRISAVDRDLAVLGRARSPHAFDVIVANPPYTRSGSGRSSPLAERRAARHDLTAPLAAWLGLHALLKNRGRYVLVFPAARTAELLHALRGRNIEPKRLRFVHSFHDRPASLVLVEALKAAGTGLEVMPPLTVHERDGGYTEELRSIYDLPRL
jgi:tRNA1(Val) A37 N6-methylase TrmN6